jgi:DNA adenine methylase
MKTPITYYGGKQRMTSAIVPMLAPHKLYCEPFFGGGAVFFAKEPSVVEVINDTNGEVVNFYCTLQRNFAELQAEIQCSLHSRDTHRQARVVYDNPDMFTSIKRAWAFWILANQSFGSSMVGGWSFDNQGNKITKKLVGKRANFEEDYSLRLQRTQIECCDALHLIKLRDRCDSLFYCDPPYFQANMGHYGGYTAQNFEDLLKVLAGIEGKFLLSSYPSDILAKYVRENAWYSIKIAGTINVETRKTTLSKAKTEVLTANYPIKMDTNMIANSKKINEIFAV